MLRPLQDDSSYSSVYKQLNNDGGLTACALDTTALSTVEMLVTQGHSSMIHSGLSICWWFHHDWL